MPKYRITYNHEDGSTVVKESILPNDQIALDFAQTTESGCSHFSVEKIEAVTNEEKLETGVVVENTEVIKRFKSLFGFK